MRPARTTKKANPVNSSKNNTTASSQGRRDAGAVVSKSQSPTYLEVVANLLKQDGERQTRDFFFARQPVPSSNPQPLLIQLLTLNSTHFIISL